MTDAPNMLMPLADIGDWIGGIFVIGILLLRLLAALAGDKAQKPANQRPQRLPDRPVERPQPPRAQPAGQARDLRSEVDEFLRQAKEGSSEPRRPEPQRPPQRRSPEPPTLEAADEPRRLVDDKPVELESANPYEGQTVHQHVQSHIKHLEESQLAEQAAHLGEDLAQTDERLQARLDAKFKHKLGRLEHRSEEPAEAPKATTPSFAADDIAGMLANPAGVRNAVILNEILQRPTDRW